MLKGHWRWSMTALFRGVALSCLIIVEVYFGAFPYWEIVSAYIAVGMLGIVTFYHIMMDYGWAEAALLFGGGFAYSAGAVIDYLDSPVIVSGVFGPHELFHLFVIAGALQHWLFIYNAADGERIVNGRARPRS